MTQQDWFYSSKKMSIWQPIGALVLDRVMSKIAIKDFDTD